MNLEKIHCTHVAGRACAKAEALFIISKLFIYFAGLSDFFPGHGGWVEEAG